MAKQQVCGQKYRIIRKNVKNINLRVLRSGEIVVSAGRLVSAARIDQFIQSKSDWIAKRLEIAKTLKNEADRNVFHDGMVVTILGKPYPIEIVESPVKQVFRCQRHDAVIIETPNPQDSAVAEKQYVKWLAHEAGEYFRAAIAKRMPLFKVYGIAQPHLAIGVMRSRWGTCNIRKKLIRLNLKLYKASPECIEYVVLHELAHLVQANHGKNFYNILSALMPDYKDLKKALNSGTGISNW